MPLSALIRRIRTKEVWCVVGSHWTSEPIAASLEDSHCCIDCANEHNGPGKYEAYSNDSQALATCLILDMWSLHSSEDDVMINEGWGYCGRFDKYLLGQDTQGFVTFEEFPTAEKAEERFWEIYADGMGAQEDDAYIYWDRWKWNASFNGKQLDIWPDRKGEVTYRRALARIRLEMIRTGYWPNVWIDQDRGSLRLVKGL